MTPRGQAAAQHDDQDEITLDGLRDQFFVAHRACERFSKVLGGVAQKLQESKADYPWLTEVGGPVCMHHLLTDRIVLVHLLAAVSTSAVQQCCTGQPPPQLATV